MLETILVTPPDVSDSLELQRYLVVLTDQVNELTKELGDAKQKITILEASNDTANTSL